MRTLISLLVVAAVGCDGSADGPPAAIADAAAETSVDRGVTDILDSGVVCEACGETAPRCPPRVGETAHVSPLGSDSTGNGSSDCPFKTITRAIADAVAVAPALTEIVLGTGGSAPAIYGDGCSNGPPCDATPIVIPATLTWYFSVRGAGAIADVVVTGAGASVFEVRAANVAFRSMTIEPTRVGPGSTGGYGIEYVAASGTLRAANTVGDVLFRGAGVGSGEAFVGPAGGVLLRDEANPTIGPGVTFRGLYDGVRVTDAAHPLILATYVRPVVFDSLQGAAIRVLTSAAAVEPTVLSSADSSLSVSIRSCVVGVYQSSLSTAPATRIAGAYITHEASSGSATGVVVARGTLEANHLSVIGPVTTAIDVDPLGTFTGDNVTVRDAALGLRVRGTANLTHLDVRGCVGDGIVCEGARLKLRSSSSVANGKSGVFADACELDLGTTSDAGNNTFNRRSKRNGGAGLCVVNTSALTASSAMFACGVAAPACEPAGTLLPTYGASTSGACPAVDIATPPGATIATPGALCCE